MEIEIEQLTQPEHKEGNNVTTILLPTPKQSVAQAQTLLNPLDLPRDGSNRPVTQPIPDRFQMPKMAVFGPSSDQTGYLVNYNIHMNLRTASKRLKCGSFRATLDEQGKTWFASLTPGSITSLK
ncbi:hypothetical protein ACLOJK_038253 [Asimina triloba]